MSPYSPSHLQRSCLHFDHTRLKSRHFHLFIKTMSEAERRMTRSEDCAREKIEALLRAAGWAIQDPSGADTRAAYGVAVRAFPLARGYGTIDYLLYVDRKAVGGIEANREGDTLSGVEAQVEKYKRGLPFSIPVCTRPLPFLYQSTGMETWFINKLDSEPRSRRLFAFHKAETLKEWLEEGLVGSLPRDMAAEGSPEYGRRGATFQERLRINMPSLVEEGLLPAQIQAIKGLEISLRENCPRVLIQMSADSDKTFTAINFIYRLIKFAGARRVLFLVDGSHAGRETLEEFQQYVSPYNNCRFSDEYPVHQIGPKAFSLSTRVCISTKEQMYAMLTRQHLVEEDVVWRHNAESSRKGNREDLIDWIESIGYNPSFPIETFDIVVVDVCDLGMDTLWRQVMAYYDASLIGLTTMPTQEIIAFFDNNLVMQYAQDGSDGLKVISNKTSGKAK